MIILILALLLLGVEVSHAQPISSPPGVIAGETDGTNRQRYREIKFTTGTTTNNADGSITIDNSPVSATGWTDNGAQVVLTTSSDNVGIGTIDPQAKLHVKGGIIADGSFSGMLLGNNMKIDGDTTRKMTFSQTAGTYNENVRFDLDTTTNTWAIDSTTGVTAVDMSPFTITAAAFVGDGSGLTGISGGASGWTDGGTNVYTTTTTDNVGIGTTTPSSGTKLDVRGNAYLSGNLGIGTTSPTALNANWLAALYSSNNGSRAIAVQNPNTGTSAESRFEIKTSDANGYIANRPTNYAAASSWAGRTILYGETGNGAAIGAASGLNITFVNSTTELMRLTGSGNLGIGTTIPITTLAVRAATASLFQLVNTSSSGSGAGAGIQGISDDNAAVVLGDRLAFYTFGGSADTGDTILNGGAVTGFADGTWSATSAPAEVRIEVAPSGSTTRAVALVADSTSNIGIGTTTPQQKLQVVGTVSATAFVGDGSGLTGLPAGGGWVDGGTNIYASPTTDNVAIGTTTPTQKLTVVGTVSATAFVGDGSGLTNLGASAWTDGGTNIYPSTTSDQVAIGTTTPVSGAALTVLGTIAGSGSGPLSITNGNVGIGTFATPTVLLHVGNTAGSPTSVGANDVYIQNDLEVDGTVYMGSCSGAGCGTGGGWTDGGANVYTTTTTDKVGIGTANPSSNLTITASSPEGRFVDTDTAGYSSFRFFNGNTSMGKFESAGPASADAGLFTVANIANYPMAFATNDTNRLTIAADGNVGIGTSTSWASKFEVRSTTSNIFSIQAAANQACNTTCVSACIGGFDNGTTGNAILACTDATADTCLCAGSN